jgi:sugar phosphate isomerase/epimerase
LNITWSVFPKFFRHLDPDGLADLVRRCGLDTVNMVVRDGYWVEPDSTAEDVPRFVQAMDDACVQISFATTGLTPDQITSDADRVRVLADNGITDFRMAYFHDKDDPVRNLEEARRAMAGVAEVCLDAGIRAVYQVHMNTLVHSATAAWYIVRDLPPEAVGVMLDPGNQGREGRENWAYSARLLGPHLAALGVKDLDYRRDESGGDDVLAKGWSSSWVPIDEGISDWHDVLRACAEVGFGGTLVFMPFYHQDDPNRMADVLGREVSWLRGIAEEVTR